MQHIKRMAFILLLFSVTGIMRAQTHEFAPIGAEWYYHVQNHWVEGFIRIASVSDTIINNHNCRKLEKVCHRYEYLLGSYDEFVVGYEYVFQEEDAVMLYRDGQFYTLFDFGASMGDTWIIPGREEDCEHSYGITHVVGTGVEEMNGHALKYVLVLDDPDSSWGYGHSLIEVSEPDTIKILECVGPIGSYLLPEQRCMFDYLEGGPLRCYSDDIIGYVNYSEDNKNCDYVNEQYQNVFGQDKDNSISIYPNPVKDGFFISSYETEEAYVEVLDAMGRTFFSGYIVPNMTYCSINACPKGLYYVVYRNNIFTCRMCIIKM